MANRWPSEGKRSIGDNAIVITGDSIGPVITGSVIQVGAQPGAGKNDLRRAYLSRIFSQANQLTFFAGDSAKAQINLASICL
jgi:predicted ATP-dependent serine protease